MSPRLPLWREIARLCCLAGFLFTHVAGRGAETDTTAVELQQSFIWLNSVPTGQQAYVAFRKSFDLTTSPTSAILRLFADSRYILWVNGQYLDRGPCRFDPVAPEYDSIEVNRFLKPGTNTITVLVHHFHDGQSTTNWVSINGRIMRHAPGLTALLKLTQPDGAIEKIRTDSSWRGSTNTRFQASPTDRWENTWSSLPDRIDARRDPGDWTLTQFDDSAWEKAVSINGKLWGALRARAIPRLRESEVGPLRLLEHSRTNTQVQQLMAINPERAPLLSTALPLSLNAGDQLIVDAGSFAQAYSVLDCDAEEGSVLELEYAQNYFDTDSKPSGSYGHLNQYITRSGLQSYMSGDTFGFKYLVVRLKSGKMELQGLRLIDRLYPFDLVGSFQCNDSILGRIWTNSIQTVRLCSEDAYVDCAARERVEWMADGYAVAYRATRVALTGPDSDGRPTWGDPRLLRNLLRHIGQSVQPDGRLKAHHPSDRWDIHGYIDDYACLWVQGLREYVDSTGDLDLARELWRPLTEQLRWFLERRTANGLVKSREFVYPGCNPLCYKVCEGTTLNAYLTRAVNDASYLAQEIGQSDQAHAYHQAAQQISNAINQHLWNESIGTYSSGILDEKTQPPSVPAAFFALHFGVVSPERRAQVQTWLLQHCRELGGLPFAYQFLFEALYGIDSNEADQKVIDLIREKWTAMAKGETQTVWEGFGPGENCHEAGAVPAYFLSAYVLGVRMNGPKSENRLLIQPRLADLQEANGIVVTELGLVPIRWKRDPSRAELYFELEIPAPAHATLSLPFKGEVPTVTLNGQIQSSVRRQGRHAILEIGPGKYRGTLSQKPD